jgi:hypothetical protein
MVRPTAAQKLSTMGNTPAQMVTMGTMMKVGVHREPTM